MLAEIIIILLAFIVLFAILRFIQKTAIKLIINSILALIMLLALNFLGFHIPITLINVLIVAIFGLLGLIFLIILHLIG